MNSSIEVKSGAGSRLKYVDDLKGVSIIAIMLLHFEDGIFPAAVNVWIGYFMITAFYFASGWIEGCSENFYGWNTWWKKRKQSLVMPYLWFSLIILGCDLIFVMLGEMPPIILLRDIYKTLTLRGIGTLWFIPALLGGEVIARTFITGTFFRKILLISISFSYNALYTIWNQNYGHLNEIYRIVDAPFRSVFDIMNAWWIIVVGFYISKHYVNEINGWSKYSKCVATLAVLGFFTLSLQSAGGAINSCFVVGPLGMMLLCMCCERWKIFAIFEYFGKNSLIVMVTHYSILQQICIFIHRYFTGMEQLGGTSAFLYFAICLILEIPFIYGINRYFPQLIGKGSLLRFFERQEQPNIEVSQPLLVEIEGSGVGVVPVGVAQIVEIVNARQVRNGDHLCRKNSRQSRLTFRPQLEPVPPGVGKFAGKGDLRPPGQQRRPPQPVTLHRHRGFPPQVQNVLPRHFNMRHNLIHPQRRQFPRGHAVGHGQRS